MSWGKFQSCHTVKDPLVDPRKCWASLKRSPTTAFFTQHFCKKLFCQAKNMTEDDCIRPLESDLQFMQHLKLFIYFSLLLLFNNNNDDNNKKSHVREMNKSKCATVWQDVAVIKASSPTLSFINTHF